MLLDILRPLDNWSVLLQSNFVEVLARQELERSKNCAGSLDVSWGIYWIVIPFGPHQIQVQIISCAAGVRIFCGIITANFQTSSRAYDIWEYLAVRLVCRRVRPLKVRSGSCERPRTLRGYHRFQPQAHPGPLEVAVTWSGE